MVNITPSILGKRKADDAAPVAKRICSGFVPPPAPVARGACPGLVPPQTKPQFAAWTAPPHSAPLMKLRLIGVYSGAKAVTDVLAKTSCPNAWAPEIEAIKLEQQCTWSITQYSVDVHTSEGRALAPPLILNPYDFALPLLSTTSTDAFYNGIHNRDIQTARVAYCVKLERERDSALQLRVWDTVKQTVVTHNTSLLYLATCAVIGKHPDFRVNGECDITLTCPSHYRYIHDIMFHRDEAYRAFEEAVVKLLPKERRVASYAEALNIGRRAAAQLHRDEPLVLYAVSTRGLKRGRLAAPITK